MDHMPDSMMHGTFLHMLVMWLGAGILGAILIAIIYLFLRPASAAGVSLVELGAARGLKLPQMIDNAGNIDTPAASAVDTVFILPDISNYTRFMTGTQFSFAHAQYIIFSLINGMIAAATKRIELSKLEGDAALFFVDADRLSKAEVGEVVMDIFRSFYSERRRLKESNICPCRACRHIDDLDLKIFVHRGQAARFRFRGSVDLFGTDVIVLHRIMKNNVKGHRYVMITDAAANSVMLPDNAPGSSIAEDVEHIGRINASVYKIDNEAAAKLAEPVQDGEIQSMSAGQEILRKLHENVRSIRYSVFAR